MPTVPLPTEMDLFWGRESARRTFLGEVRISSDSAGLLKRLGNFPFWRGEENFASALEAIYREAAAVGFQTFLIDRNP